MKEFTIAELIEITGGTFREPDSGKKGRSFTGVSIDSRTIKAGDCFFAVRGEHFDGHDYVSNAFAKGAACAVVEKDPSGKNFGGNCILKVNDTIKALGDLAGEYRRRANFKIVAITGSAGKTTVRQIIHHVLSNHFRVHQSPKSFNNKIGLPLTLLGADLQDEIIIAELGSNHPGEISYLTRIAAPEIAVVTNVYPAHLEGFGDLQTIIQEKLSISEGLPNDGILIINADCEGLVDVCRANGTKFITFGKSESSDYQAENIRCEGSSGRFTIENTEIHLPLAGPGNLENALAAWTVCSQLGLTIDQFASAVENLPAVSMRSEVLQIGTLTILNDCYNANPASMKNALQILAGLDPAGKRRLVFICGDMAELGNQAEHFHVELGTIIVKTGVKLLLTVGKLAKIAAETAKSTARYNMQTKCFDDTLSACNNLHEFIKDNDIILVKGSRTAMLEKVVEKLKELTNDN
jgi:UDP-N-acetylmuramoyl-tripeptide--D-alanyl-D-alanine ligase